MDIPWDMIGAFVGGGGLMRLLHWLEQRSKTRAYTMGAVDHAVETAMKSVTTELERVNREMATLREEHKNCQKELAESKAGMTELRQRLDEIQINRMMEGPVPGYTK